MVFLTFFTTLCYAKDISFEATVDKNKVSLGKGITLSLTFHATQDISAPKPPQIENFESRYLGPSTMMSIVNGRVTSSITHNYILIPLKKGTFTIEPIQITYKGKTYKSKPIQIEVVEGPVRVSRSRQPSAEAQGELEDRVFITMQPEKSKIYLNEKIPLSIKLYVNRVAIRDVRYPEFEHEGFSIDQYEKPKQYQEGLAGVQYDVIEFKTNIFGTRPGEFTLGPGYLKCNLVVRKRRSRRPSSFFNDFFGEDIFEDFFGRYETYPLNLKSIQIPVTVLTLPEVEKPLDFSGAVGSFNFNMQAEPKQIKVGDPVTLKMIISGKGNFNTVKAPMLHLQKGFKVYEPQIEVKDNAKIFEQVLMPKSEKITEIPAVSFSFFEPEKQQYQTITRGPIPISVMPLEKEEELKIVEYPEVVQKPIKKEILGRDIIYIKETPRKFKRRGAYLYRNKGFLLLQLLPIILLVFVLGAYKRVEKLRTDVRYARRLQAPKKAKAGIRKAQRLLQDEKSEEFYSAIFKTLQEYLGDKFHLAAGGITIDIVDAILKPRNVDKDILNKLKRLFKECDMVRYAPSEFGKEKMHESLKRLGEIIDYFQRQKV